MTIAISSVSSVSSVFTERALRRPMAADVRRRLDADISIVFRMLNRCDWVREFILGSNVSADLLMLMSPLGAQSSFILETEEHQEGRLTGSIKLRYLVVPSFTTPEGLSGGAIVTSYALRDHPLHSPSVMANTRIGRYVRDNNTGEWLFLTRNETDNVTRMQWLHSSKSTTRERINLTCNSTLFNKGLLAESILFECHDEEWRPCPRCHSPPDANCSCSASGTAVALPKHPLDLRSVAAAALTEPKSEWFGRVQVSILSNLTKDLRGDVDACMNLRTSFEASQDAALALQMQNLALAERAKTVIPRHVSTPKLLTSGHVTGAAGAFGLHANAFSSFQKNAEESRSVLQSPVPLGADTHYSSLPNGSMSHVMTEMLSGRDEKYVTLDAVVPELENRADKKVTQEVQNNGGSAFGAVPQQQMFSSPSVFDPMSLMVKHFAAGSPGNTLAPGSPGPGLQNVTVPHSGLANGHLQGLQQQRLQHQDKQQLQHNHEHQHLVMNATPADQNQSATLLHRVHDFSHGAPGQHAQGHSQSSHSSHSSGGRVDAEDEDEDDDDGGVFDTDAGRHRMSNTKAFDTFLGTFVAPHQTSVIPSASAAASVDVNSLDNMELDSPWLNAGPLPSTVQKENPSLPSHDTQAHGEPEHVMPQRMQARVVAPPPQHGNPFPPHPISNGVHQRSSPLVLKQAMPVTPPNGPPKREHQGFVQSLGSPSANGVDQVSGDPVDPESGQPLARLEPRPPGMSACADGAWMWHMGPRGPFGMAAIAAARERERRAEERRRKNREAAARSNARAKERLERIKGELEKNKDRISRLSRKRRELELQNNTLKQRLAQQAS